MGFDRTLCFISRNFKENPVLYLKGFFPLNTMTNSFKERESICHENRKMLLDNINSVKFLLSGGKADTPDQDLTINKLFLRDKELGKRGAQLLVKTARDQFKLFLQKIMDIANVNTLNFLRNESRADLDLIVNNGIACISLNKGESVINCESFVNLTDELLKVTGFDELQLIKRNDCREVDDASDIILSVPTLNEELSISKPLCTENSERDDTERNEGGVADEHLHSSEYDIFHDASPVSEKETTTTQDWKNLNSYISTHLAKTAKFESENTEVNEGMAVDEDSDSSEFVTRRSKTGISSQGFVNDGTARNSNSDYSESDDTEGNSESDDTEGNSESDDTERNDGGRIDVDSDSSESVIFREGSPVSENENMSRHTSEPDISSPGPVNGDNVSDLPVDAYTSMRETVLQKHQELFNHYTDKRLKAKGKVAIVYKNTADDIETVYCDDVRKARQKAYSLNDVQKNPYAVVFIDKRMKHEETPSILADLHARERNFPNMKFKLDTGADEGSISFDESLLKNFTFTVDLINDSYEPSVLSKFTTECTEPQDVHVFDVDKDPDWNAIGLPLLEKCVVFFDMKNDKCLLRKHEDVIIEETEEGRKISIVEKRVTPVSLARSWQRRGAVKQKAEVITEPEATNRPYP